jgi:hypothetical protein
MLKVGRRRVKLVLENCSFAEQLRLEDQLVRLLLYEVHFVALEGPEMRVQPWWVDVLNDNNDTCLLTAAYNLIALR